MFTFLHTNDFHDKLTQVQAGRLKALLGEVMPNGILLDAGDAGGSGNITFRTSGEPIFDLMNEAGYSAMTMGNRDFHFSRLGLHSKLFRADFPILCANIRYSGIQRNPDHKCSNDRDVPSIRPYLIYDAAPEWRIAIFGLTVPMITERMLARKVSAYVFDEPISAARRVIAEIRKTEHFDVLVGLTHIGIKQDRILAETLPEIDVIIGGHTHVVLPEGIQVGKTLIVQGGARGKFIGRIQVEKAAPGEGSLRARASLEPL